MIIAIHQPECLPWMGFFNKMHRAHRYVVFDHVQYKKRYFENRNRIKLGNKATWVTVPVESKGKFVQCIKDVEIDNSMPWQDKMIRTIHHGYAKTPYYHRYFHEIERLIGQRTYSRLIDFNLQFIEWFRSVLSIETPMVRSSDLNVDGYQGSELILQINRVMGAHQYLCGVSGRDYLKEAEFRNTGVEIVWQCFQPQPYPQTGDGFIANLSTLDLVFNCGPDSARRIQN